MDFYYRMRVALITTFIGVASGIAGYFSWYLEPWAVAMLWVLWLIALEAMVFLLVLDRRVPTLFPDEAHGFVDTYKKEAEEGDALAAYVVGRCYESGTGVSIDMEQAKSWYLRAAAQKLPQAKRALARLRIPHPDWESGDARAVPA